MTRVKTFGLVVALICSAMSSLGWAQTSDTIPPSLAGFSFSPSNVDVTAGPQSMTVTARITDDLSGASFSFFTQVRSPAGNQSHGNFIQRTGGTPLDGTYSGVVETSAQEGNARASVT